MTDHPTNATRRLPVELLLFPISPLFFAANMLLARAVVGGVPPVTLSFLRWTVAGLVLLPFTWRGLRANSAQLLTIRFALLALTGGVLAVAPLYAAASLTSAGNISLLVASSPVFVLLAERVLFGVRLRPGALVGIAMAALGVATVVTHGNLGSLSGFAFNAGDGLAFCAMASWVAYTLLSKRRPVTVPPMVGLSALCLGAATILLPAALLELLHNTAKPSLGLHLDARGMLALLFLCLVPSIGAYGSYQALVRHVGPARAAVSMYMVPVYAMLLAVPLLGERLHPFHAAGLSLILGGVCIAALPTRQRRPSVAGNSALLSRA